MSERLEGINSIREALRAGRKIEAIYTTRKAKDALRAIVEQALQKNIPVHELEKGALERMASSDSHQGVLADAEPFRYRTIDDILESAADKGEHPLLLLLDGIEDPHNLGAIMRTAECMGVHGIVLPKHSTCRVTPAVSRASAGASEHLRVAEVNNLVQTIKDLKDKGLWIVGTDSAAKNSCYQQAYPEALGLVIGGEGRGMRRLVKENCDFMVSIPLKGSINSLNASVSSAIILYEIIRQRSQA